MECYNDIFKIEDEYGLPIIHMAITYLLDVGLKNFTEDQVDKMKADALNDKSETKISFEIKIAIIECCEKLSGNGAKLNQKR